MVRAVCYLRTWELNEDEIELSRSWAYLKLISYVDAI